MSQRLTRDRSTGQPLRSGSGRGRSPRATLNWILLVAVIVLAAALVVVIRSNDHPTASGQASVVDLQTQVAHLQAQVGARQTEVAQQQRSIAQLRQTIAAQGTPGNQANGSRGFLVSFQEDKYSYVLFLQWVEKDGFIHDGRLLTADSLDRRKTRSFQLGGVDNSGNVGFTGSGQGETMTFTGKVDSHGNLTVTGVPWSVFNGFVGGTFSRTLHPGTLDAYNSAVANLPNPPK